MNWLVSSGLVGSWFFSWVVSSARNVVEADDRLACPARRLACDALAAELAAVVVVGVEATVVVMA